MTTRASSTCFLPYDPSLIPLAKELRKKATPAERKLWYTFLRGYFPHFYFQRPIDHYIVDFYCPAQKLVIELDGDIHAIGNAEQEDEKRTMVLESYSLKVIRFTNRDVLETFNDVVREITILCGNESE
jgi:very-short-patch-repair endonuclease